MPCIKHKLSFNVFIVDPRGKEHPTGKTWSIDLKRYNEFHKINDTLFNENRLGPTFLKDLYNFTGNHVPSYQFRWAPQYTRAQISYGGAVCWSLKRII